MKEAIYIRKEQDKSMNRDEGSYQLSHIYDMLFAPKLSGERRLDRPFRRRLQSKEFHFESTQRSWCTRHNTFDSRACFFLSPDQQSGIHCAIHLLTLNISAKTCFHFILRSVSHSECLRNLAVQLDIYILTFFVCVEHQGWTLASDSVQDEPFVVRGLRPGTSYRFIVRAQNSHGLSVPSPVTGVVKTRGQRLLLVPAVAKQLNK